MDDDFFNDVIPITHTVPRLVPAAVVKVESDDNDEIDVVFEKLVAPRVVADKTPKHEQEGGFEQPQQYLLRLKSSQASKREQENSSSSGQQQLTLRLSSKASKREQDSGSNGQQLLLRLSSKDAKQHGGSMMTRLAAPKEEGECSDGSDGSDHAARGDYTPPRIYNTIVPPPLFAAPEPPRMVRSMLDLAPPRTTPAPSWHLLASAARPSSRSPSRRSHSRSPDRRRRRERSTSSSSTSTFRPRTPWREPSRRSRSRSPQHRASNRDHRDDRSRSPQHRASNRDHRDDRYSRTRDSPRRDGARDRSSHRAQSSFHPRSDYGQSSVRAQSVMPRFEDRDRTFPSRRSSIRDDNDDAGSVISGTFVRGEVQVLNNPVFPKREKKEGGESPDDEDDLRILMDTRRSRSPSHHRRSVGRSMSRTPFGSIEANIKKRPGDDNDPVCFDWDNPTATLRDEPVTITVFSDQEKANFRMVMLDPTYGTYPMEAARVTRGTEHQRAVKIYEFEFTPIMFGPHLLVLTMDDFFRVHSLRVHGSGPPPQRRNNDNRPPLPRISVHGVHDDVRKLFHAPRPRRDDEKFVDPRRVLEGLLG